MASEYAPQHVDLVHDDVLQTAKERGPTAVVGQDPDVQHVGVRQHGVGVATNPGTGITVGVAVVYGWRDLGDSEGVQRPVLVLSEGLRGEHEQRRRATVCQGRLDDGRLVAE